MRFSVDSTVGAFAAKDRGKSIEFDGSIGALNNHEGYDTRYDILISYGDFSATGSQGGPSFRFRGVGIVDLHLAGSDVPDTIKAGVNLHVVARVGDFIDLQCLFLLDPIATAIREAHLRIAHS